MGLFSRVSAFILFSVSATLVLVDGVLLGDSLSEALSTTEFGITSPPTDGDFGDAPDNSFEPVEAYPGVPGRFPTFKSTRNSTHDSAAIAGANVLRTGEEMLGTIVSRETDANGLNDRDYLPNHVDRDSDDAKLAFHRIGEKAYLSLDVTIAPGAPEQVRFLNALIDINGDGRWNSSTSTGSKDKGAEWVVRNMKVSIAPGETRIVTTPEFTISILQFPKSFDLRERWTRLTLTRAPIQGTSDTWDGSGTFQTGEVEDHIFQSRDRDNLPRWARTIRPPFMVPPDLPPNSPPAQPPTEPPHIPPEDPAEKPLPLRPPIIHPPAGPPTTFRPPGLPPQSTPPTPMARTEPPYELPVPLVHPGICYRLPPVNFERVITLLSRRCREGDTFLNDLAYNQNAVEESLSKMRELRAGLVARHPESAAGTSQLPQASFDLSEIAPRNSLCGDLDLCTEEGLTAYRERRNAIARLYRQAIARANELYNQVLALDRWVGDAEKLEDSLMLVGVAANFNDAMVDLVTGDLDDGALDALLGRLEDYASDAIKEQLTDLTGVDVPVSWDELEDQLVDAAIEQASQGEVGTRDDLIGAAVASVSDPSELAENIIDDIMDSVPGISETERETLQNTLVENFAGDPSSILDPRKLAGAAWQVMTRSAADKVQELTDTQDVKRENLYALTTDAIAALERLRKLISDLQALDIDACESRRCQCLEQQRSEWENYHRRRNEDFQMLDAIYGEVLDLNFGGLRAAIFAARIRSENEEDAVRRRLDLYVDQYLRRYGVNLCWVDVMYTVDIQSVAEGLSTNRRDDEPMAAGIGRISIGHIRITQRTEPKPGCEDEVPPCPPPTHFSLPPASTPTPAVTPTPAPPQASEQPPATTRQTEEVSELPDEPAPCEFLLSSINFEMSPAVCRRISVIFTDGLDQQEPGTGLDWNIEGESISGRFDYGDHFEGEGGEQCREFSQSVKVGRRRKKGDGAVCRAPDGPSWDVTTMVKRKESKFKFSIGVDTGGSGGGGRGDRD